LQVQNLEKAKNGAKSGTDHKCIQSWLRESAQGAKWFFCLT